MPQLAPIQPGEDLSFGHAIPVLGIHFDDRKAVDSGGDLSFLTRNQSARNEQSVDELTLGRLNDGHGRRLDFTRLFGRNDRGRGAGPRVGAEFP